MCMLNGRYDCILNNFTSVSTKGSSVMDYYVVPHESLSRFLNFKVSSTLDLINDTPGLCQIASSGIPDHSLLTWNIVADDLGNFKEPETLKSGDSVTFYDRFNLDEIPDAFLLDNDSWQFVNVAIDTLERGRQDQHDIDTVYSKWCDYIKVNMYNSIPYKRHYPSRSAKKHRPGKPWWNDKLSDMWAKLSQAESSWLKSFCHSEKTRLKSEYVRLRKGFDKEVQRAKRFHWYSIQSELENECNIDQSCFWKSIGKKWR